MQIAPTHRRLGAFGFVLAAVALATIAAVLISRGDRGTSQPDIIGPGAAPAAIAQAPTQRKVYGTSASAQQVAAQASGASGSEQVPLSARYFRIPIAHYRTYAARQVATLAARTRVLTDALRRGDRAGAEAAWQQADSTFARIGAAYGALGSLGDAIDGGPGGLPRGVHDPGFTGLQRIEYGLWSGADPASLTRYGRRLRADVARLKPVLRSAPIDPLVYATRAHEILEDVQRDRLSASTPSDSGVRATADGVAATRVVLSTLAGLLYLRGGALNTSEVWLHRLATTVHAIRTAHGGHYPPVAQLSRSERERLDGTLGATLEALAGIPSELETKPPPTFARIP